MRFLLYLWPTAALAILMVSSAQAATDFVLNENCPPSFEKMDSGRCELRNLYQFYDSLQDMGVGGTKTSLPAHRDGFSDNRVRSIGIYGQEVTRSAPTLWNVTPRLCSPTNRLL